MPQNEKFGLSKIRKAINSFQMGKIHPQIRIAYIINLKRSLIWVKFVDLNSHNSMQYLKRTLLLLFLGLVTIQVSGQAPPLFGWQKCLGGSSVDASQKIVPCTNNDILIVGNTQSANGDVISNHGSRDYWMTRLNASGQLLWSKTYGGPGSDIATLLLRTG
jgi:hypothetical protein